MLVIRVELDPGHRSRDAVGDQVLVDLGNGHRAVQCVRTTVPQRLHQGEVQAGDDVVCHCFIPLS